jgi:ABC-type oligopeptide transport system substrate-binding subunit
MPRPSALALAAALALSAACATSPCQELGEKLCGCQPGTTQDSCRTQVQEQLNALGVGNPGFNGLLDHVEDGKPVTFEDYCQARLDQCTSKATEQGAVFCEFLLTEEGKDLCGLTPKFPPP